MWHLLMAHQQESFHPFSSRQSLSCFLSHVAKGSNPKLCGPNSLSSCLVLTFCQSHVAPEKTHGPKKRHAKWMRCVGLNLPLQPHFQLLPQLATAASIPRRCGPMVWSQLSPSSSGPHYRSLFGAPLLAAPCYTSTAWDLGRKI